MLVALGMLAFGLRFAGALTPFLVGAIIYLFCCVAFGVMAGTAIDNQAAAIQFVSMVCFLLSFLLSGFIFPLSNVPMGIRWIAYFVPAQYFIEITRDAFVRGAGWSTMWQGMTALAGLGTFFLFTAWRKMRRMQVEV